ncbi:Ribosomal protein S18 acetylase RimI [Rhizobiales bacterium GAS191]|jgi:GNAT superfamily N-acetyltransferase|nr:Ribosomal protein S18 acetylase RimI [Rhizobiales bacterium GAS113]SED98278.1 Ribosomal protein S18 acetylase RimI [Rhizobiales bacterium GAS188]SEE54643.1 Ribosomal protein S18 acetylase RimI [Rhizobiales bacterium GAS191]
MSAANPPLPLGYSMLEPGRIANVVTYLEMKARPAPRERPPSSLDLVLEPCDGSDLDAYRALFRRVGQEWLWYSRLVMSDAQLRTILEDPKVEIHRLCQGREAVGLLELDFRIEGECELAYFGIVSSHIGKGAGRHLMELAIDRAWAKPIRRLFLHTCNFDHPRALEFYQRSGFRPYKLAVEVLEDPRLSGHLPRGAAPQMPIIEMS